MKILIISNIVPYPPISGGALRNYSLLRRIAKHHQVWLATHLECPEEIEGIPHLNEFCQSVVTGLIRRRSKLFHLPGLINYALKGWPLELKFRHSKEMAYKIHQLCTQVDFDIIQIEESRMALYLEVLPRNTQSKRILTYYDVAYAQCSRFLPLTQSSLEKIRLFLYSKKMRKWEPSYSDHFERIITVSEEDRSLLLAGNPHLNVNVIPNGVDTQKYQPLPIEWSIPSLIFIGNMSYLPCIDAAKYFINEILPYVQQVIPQIETWIVGSDPVPEVKCLDGEHVHVTGRVSDILPYYRRSAISVVPIRAGGGTRLKILEAMALGRPVVSTTIGSEGLNVTDGEHLLIANRPEHFARQIIRLLENRTEYQRIKANARDLVEQYYSWDVITEKLLQVYSELSGKAKN